MDSFVLPVDKPVGPTSHDIVSIARRALGERRIGHTGTLDPFASGLMLLCVGQATRLAEYLTDLPKTYVADARFDGVSTTDDATGDITHSESWRDLSADVVRDVLQQFLGRIEQVPSTFSAKKIDGERAYDRARRGEDVQLAPVEVTIYNMQILETAWPAVRFEVECSSGTYVRAIARDVGKLIGTGGYLAQLRRTAVGPYDVANALNVDTLVDKQAVEAKAISLVDAVKHLDVVQVTEEEEKALRFGQPVMRSVVRGTIAIVRDDRLIAMASSDGERIKPKKVFP